jgi:hypothetical protein
MKVATRFDIVPIPISKTCLNLVLQAEADQQRISESCRLPQRLVKPQNGSCGAAKLLSHNAARIHGLPTEGL